MISRAITTTTIAVLLAMAAASITVPGVAFAQISIPEVQIPQIQIPEVPGEEDLIPCLPPPACLLPGAEVCIQVCYPPG
jgi:hypothetical protein